MGFGSILGPTALNFLAQNSIESMEFEETRIHSPHNFELENFDPDAIYMIISGSNQYLVCLAFSSMFYARLTFK